MELLFTNAGLLWGTAAVSVPVALHLINRTRAKKVPFTALRFIEQALANRSIKYRFREILLLLLRIALLALCAFLLARPFLRSALFGQPSKIRSTAVLILDDSFSMSYRLGERSLFEAAREEALRALDRMGPGSRVSFFPMSEGPGTLTLDLEAVRERIRAWEPSSRSAECLPAVAKAGGILAPAKTGQKEIFLFTDATRTSWDGLSPAAARLAPDQSLYVIDAGAEPDRNGAILALATGKSERSRARFPTEFRATLRGGDAPMDRKVELVVGKTVVDTRRVTLGRYETASVAFLHTFEKGGLAQGSVRFSDGDALTVDDERFFTLRVRETVRALLVREEAGDRGDVFLRQALAPDGLAKRTPVVIEPGDVGRLESGDLSETDLVILSDVGSLSGSGWAKLGEFVRAGGGLLVFAGDRVETPAYTPEASGGVLPASVRGRRTVPEQTFLEISDPSHPVFVGFSGGLNGDPGVRVFRRYLILKAADDPRVRVLARFQGGSPALVERELGEGKVLFFASSSDSSWNDLPSHGAPYVPLMHFLVRHATGRNAPLPAPLVGESVALPLPPRSGSEVRVRWPAKEETTYLVDRGQVELVLQDTRRQGNATVTGGRGALAAFSINVDPRESRRDRVPAVEISGGFGPESYVRVSKSVSMIDRRVSGAGGRFDLYPCLILLLLVLFVGEALYANRV